MKESSLRLEEDSIKSTELYRWYIAMSTYDNDLKNYRKIIVSMVHNWFPELKEGDIENELRKSYGFYSFVEKVNALN